LAFRTEASGGRTAPREAGAASLRGKVPAEALDLFPDRWERLGDVVVLRIPAPLAPWSALVGEALARVLGCRAALENTRGVVGEFREMAAPVLWHDGSRADPAVTVHREHGILYALDASRIMFSSGNVEERARMGRLDCRGETVVDLFAGIGYFAIPIAKRTGATRVVAVEKNPVAHRFLLENARLNRVGAVLEPVLGDNRETPLPTAQRVLLGYVGRTAEFLPRAFEVADPAGATLHYHDTFGVDAWREEAEGRVRTAAEAAGFRVEAADTHAVKSYAPAVVHAVVDARVRHAP